MASVRVVLNLAGIRELKRSPGVTSLIESKGRAVLEAARAGAPVVSGEYQQSLKLVMDTHPISGSVAHVITTSDHGFIVEANTGNLSRALDAAGGS